MNSLTQKQNMQCLPISYPNYATRNETLVFFFFPFKWEKLIKGNTPSLKKDENMESI